MNIHRETACNVCCDMGRLSRCFRVTCPVFTTLSYPATCISFFNRLLVKLRPQRKSVRQGRDASVRAAGNGLLCRWLLNRHLPGIGGGSSSVSCSHLSGKLLPIDAEELQHMFAFQLVCGLLRCSAMLSIYMNASHSFSTTFYHVFGHGRPRSTVRLAAPARPPGLWTLV